MDGNSSLGTMFVDLSAAGLVLSLLAAAGALLLAVVVAAINLSLRRWVTAGVMSVSWALVLVRLMMPLAPQSMLSLQNLWRLVPSNDAQPPAAGSLPDLAATTVSSGQVHDAAEAHDAALRAGEGAMNLIEPTSLFDLLATLLPMMWVAGLLALLSATLIANWRFHRALRQSMPCEDPRAIALWEECRRRVGRRRVIPLLHVDTVDQVAIAGLWRPKLLLPPAALHLAEEELRMVMLHELGHVRRRDIAANWLLAIVRAVHWWNPVYWLAAARFQALREQACDAFALRHLEGRPARAYGELLLKLFSQPVAHPRWQIILPASIVGFLSGFVRRRGAQPAAGAANCLGVARTMADRLRGDSHGARGDCRSDRCGHAAREGHA